MSADVEAALRRPAWPKPLEWSGDPLSVTFTRVEYCDRAMGCGSLQRIDGRTVAVKGDSFDEVFRTFLICVRLSALEG